MRQTTERVTADILMPRLSDSMEEGTILTWMKAVGDEVAVGDELVEIETDKANMVHEADSAGTLIEITAQEGDTLAIGEVIARVRKAGGAANTPSDTGGSAGAKSPEKVKASPVARRMATEAALDLASISGSGPDGRVVKADVQQAIASSSAPTPTLPPLNEKQRSAPSPAQAGIASSLARGEPPSAPDFSPASAGTVRAAAETPETATGTVERVELSKLQQTVGRRMAESKATTPHFYLQATIDMSRCVAARAALKQSASVGEVVPSVNDMVVKACAVALGEFPRANGAYRDGKWELYGRINVGVAVAAREGLVVPTIFDANLKGLRQIAAEARELARKVREQTITPPELSGATFTVSNLGMYGVSNFHPVINSPQAAILAVGEISETPVLEDGGLATTQLMGVTLACDHRILYGADGAEFLARVRALLEEPLGLAL